MDDELGYYYIWKDFERHTQRPEKRPRILIVDGHSLHICWAVIQHALNHDAHVIQLPSKSTHLLEPLDVGCFALLQAAHEHHLRAWLLDNPLSVIRKVDFLGLLYKARKDTVTGILTTLVLAKVFLRLSRFNYERIEALYTP